MSYLQHPVFKRNKEDFTCEHCGVFVVGNGYTNHCPKCLYSRHVDDLPGDRRNPCLGMMVPCEIVSEKGDFVLSHKCVSCGVIKRNRISKKDDFDAALKAVEIYKKELQFKM